MGEIADLQRQLQQAQEELSLARENHITFAEDAAEVMVRYEAERDAAIERGRRGCEALKAKDYQYRHTMLSRNWWEKRFEEERERAEAAEARIDCKDGWLSSDLECGRGDDPSCWKHKLGIVEKKLAHLEGERGASDNDCPYLADKIRAERYAAEQRALAERIVEQAGGALEVAANDLEALDAGVKGGKRGGITSWALARKAIDSLYAMLTPAEALRPSTESPQGGQKEGD